MIQFQHSNYLYFLLVLPFLVGLYFFALYKKKQIAQKIADDESLKLLTASYNPKAYRIKFILSICAIALLIFAVSGPRKISSRLESNTQGIDILIALDISKSMLAKDIEPSRLESAKQCINKIINRLQNDRIAIVLFAGRSYIQMPLSSDYTAAKMYVNSAVTESAPTKGTAIANALSMSRNVFNLEEKKNHAVVLFSDGEDHEEGALKMARTLSNDGIIIHTVGVGSATGSTIEDEKTGQYIKDGAGQVVISRLNEPFLKEIAATGKGQYFHRNRTVDITDSLLENLKSIKAQPIKDPSTIQYTYFFIPVLLIVFLLLLIESFISEKRIFRKLKRNPTLLSFLFVFWLLPVHGQTSKKIILAGNIAYQKADYSEAVKNYKNVESNSTDYPIACYNLGNAFLKQGKMNEAIKAYELAAGSMVDPILKSYAYYNLGVAYQQSNRINECIEAYKLALKTDPTNEDARHNLQLALKKEKHKKQDPQNKQQKKQENDQQEEKKKKNQSKISKKDAREKLQSLMQQEQQLQEKINRNTPGTIKKPEKDW